MVSFSNFLTMNWLNVLRNFIPYISPIVRCQGWIHGGPRPPPSKTSLLKIYDKKAYQYKQLFNLCSKCSNHLYSVLNVIHFDLYILGSSPSLAKKIKNKEENIALELTLNTPENIEKCICSEKEYNWL